MSIDPTTRFSDRVENYVRHRPGYPPEVVDVLKIESALSPSDVVADVGSGTGILSELFLKAGNEVIGVEPNPAMRRAAETLLSRYPGFRSVEGSAEATTLPRRGVDLVVAGQAFHWFDRSRARAEFLRILRGRARVALLWNERKTAGSRFSERYEELLRVFGTDYAAVDHRNLGRRDFDRFFGAGGWTSIALPNEQRFDLEGLRGRLLSSSYVPGPGAPRHDEMLDQLSKIFAETRENGFVRMEYETKVYFGELRRR